MEFLGSAADQDIKNQFGDLVQDQMALVRESFKYFRQIALIKYEMVTLPRDSDAYQSAKGKVCSLSDDLAFTVRQATRKDEARVKSEWVVSRIESRKNLIHFYSTRSFLLTLISVGPHFICTSTSAPLDSVEAHAHAARMPFANETAESAHFPRSQSSAGVSGLDGTVDYLLELLGSLISLSHPVPVPNTQSIKGNAPTIQIVLIYE